MVSEVKCYTTPGHKRLAIPYRADFKKKKTTCVSVDFVVHRMLDQRLYIAYMHMYVERPQLGTKNHRFTDLLHV